MAKVIDEWHIKQYTVLTLDNMDTPHDYRKYVIGGKTFEPVMLYDMPNCIAIESGDSFVGQTVEFV